MKKTVLLTRPRSASERWAVLLSERGFDTIIEPLMSIEATGAPRPGAVFQAVVITSANAPDILGALPEDLAGLTALPCFCVGAATGAAARAIGFTDIHCGASDSAELAHNIAAALTDNTFPLLHIAGDVVDGKAREILTEKGFTLSPWSVYRTVLTPKLSHAVLRALARGDIGAIPVFSPRSAQALVSLIEKNNLVQACSCITAVALSPAVADVLKVLPWLQLRVAAAPEEKEVLACLQTELVMTEKNQEEIPAAPRKKRTALKAAITLGVVAGVCGFIYLPRFEIPAAPSVTAPVTQPVAQAVDAAPPVVEPQSAAPDVAALQEKIHALESHLAALQAREHGEQKAAQVISTALAFFELRQAAQEGRNFSAPLLALRARAQDDAALTELLARVEPYASTPALPFAALREDFAQHSKNLPQAKTLDPQDYTARLLAALKPLITIRPMHDSRVADVEKALADGNIPAVQTALVALPEDVAQSLAPWRIKFEMRAAQDDAVRALTAHFTPTPSQGAAP